MPNDLTTVLDIVIACRRIHRFLAGAEESTFLDDEEKQWAVVSQLMVVGEAVRRLTDQFCDDRPDIPWRQMAGMRNRLVHQYDTINWSLVWKTAKEDVATLLSELGPIVTEAEEEHADDSE